jgi:hypothetical protein
MDSLKRPSGPVYWNAVPNFRKRNPWKKRIAIAGIAASGLAASALWTGCLLETREQPPVLLFMGNSITKSDTNAAVGWGMEAGMAASSVERDYVHRTIRILKDNGRAMTPVLGARDCDTAACDGPIEEFLNNIAQVYDLKPKYAVVQLGENSTDLEVISGKLRTQYHALLEALARTGVRRIFCISTWPDTSLLAPRPKAVRQAMNGVPQAVLVDITKVSADPANAGDPALYTNPAVLWHPGDRGMDGIAKALADAILKEE